MSEKTTRAAIVGAGSIGVAFAVVFARAGWSVCIQDPDPLRRAAVGKELAATLADLAHFGLLTESEVAIAQRVSIMEHLKDAVQNADLVQECAPEQAALKKDIFESLEMYAPADAVLASSSSALPVSVYASHQLTRERCLVAHPGNPPFLIPVIEIVPAAFTSPSIVDRAEALYRCADLKPVRVHGEPEGFVFNRLQGALLREAYCLVRDGVASTEDIDTVVRDGLGLRWSFMGPFETVDLNTRGGIVSHAQKMGPAYARMGAQRGQDDSWTEELVARVDAQRREQLPLEQWSARVKWRDRMLMRLRRHREIEGSEPWPTMD